MRLPQRATRPEKQRNAQRGEKGRATKRVLHKSTSTSTSQLKAAQVGWPLATRYSLLATCNSTPCCVLRATCYRCHSPAGLAVRHMQIPVQVKVEHAQFGHSALPQRNIRRRCPSSSTSSGSSSCCHASRCTSTSSCSCSYCDASSGTPLCIWVHHDGAARCRAGKQSMRRVAPSMATAAAANTSMMTVMPVTVVMLVMFLQRVETARRTAREGE